MGKNCLLFKVVKNCNLKNIVSIFLCIVIIFSAVPNVNISATDERRYVVLVLDTAGTTNFMKSETEIAYSAISPIDEVKETGKKFIESVITSNSNTYISIVSYSNDAILVADFESDSGKLYSKIDELYSDGGRRNMKAGLKLAHEQLETIDTSNSKKTVVLVSPGMTDIGGYNYEGHWTEESEGATWQNPETQVKLYAYANAAFSEAKLIKAHAKLYTIGLVGNMKGCPEDVKGVAQLFRNTLEDIASDKDSCFLAEDISEFRFSFGELTNIYNGTYSSDGYFSYASGSKQDYEAYYYYDDLYFADPAEKYNPSLATMSLCLAMSAFASNRMDVPQYQNVVQLLVECGFDEITTNRDFSEIPEMDSIGAAAGIKTVYYDNAPYTIIAVAMRGANYYSEWGGNFEIGETGNHEGFSVAEEKVLGLINGVVTRCDELGKIKGGIKLWITGFSRGGAVANLVAGHYSVNKKIGLNSEYTIVPQNIYAYCFEPPRGVNKDEAQKLGIITESYKNIHNIINLNDIVPRVAMEKWGFARYGVDNTVIPMSQKTYSYKKDASEMMKRYVLLVSQMEKIENQGEGENEAYKSYIDIEKYINEAFISVFVGIKEECDKQCRKHTNSQIIKGNKEASYDLEEEYKKALEAFWAGKEYCILKYDAKCDFRKCPGYDMFDNAYEFYKGYTEAYKYAYEELKESGSDRKISQWVSKIDLFHYYYLGIDRLQSVKGISTILSKKASFSYDVKQDFLCDELVRALADCVGSRRAYYSKLQAGISTFLYFSMKKEGLPLDVSDILDCLGKALNSTIHNEEDDGVTIKAFYEYFYNFIISLLQFKGVDIKTELSNEELITFRKEIWKLAEVVLNDILNTEDGINMVYSLISNIKLLGYAHYPELCLAWLQSRDPNYTGEASRVFYPTTYRIIRINCPVDVIAFDSKGIKVAEIVENVPQLIKDSIVTCMYTSDGEKVIYLPVDEEFDILITARETGTMDFSINEFEDGWNYTRITNYNDIELLKDDKISVHLPKEFYNSDDEMDCFIATDSSLVKDDIILQPTIDIFGDSINEHIYNIFVSNENTLGGVVSGGGEYVEGSYVTIQAVEYEDCIFDGWYEDGEKVSADREYRFRVTEDRYLVAKFEGNTKYGRNGVFTILAQADEGGYILGDETITALDGYPIKIVAEPYVGYEFVEWETEGNCIIDNVSDATTIVTIVDSDAIVIANFKKVDDTEYSQNDLDNQSGDNLNNNDGLNTNDHGAEHEDYQNDDNVIGSDYQIVYDGISVIYENEVIWDGGYNGRIVIYNNSDKAFSEWELDFDLPNVITNIWNAQIIERKDGKYLIKDVGWNSIIPAHSYISLGYTANGNIYEEPSGFVFKVKAHNTDSCLDTKTTFVKTNEWSEGCTGEIIITNTSNTMLKDWSITFECDFQINSLWNGVLISKEGTKYTIGNAGYNYAIEPGSSVSIGINVSGNNESELPREFSIMWK